MSNNENANELSEAELDMVAGGQGNSEAARGQRKKGKKGEGVATGTTTPTTTGTANPLINGEPFNPSNIPP